MRKISLSPPSLLARLRAAVAQRSRSRPSIRPRPMPRSRRRFRPRRPTGSRASSQDETMKQCSAHRQHCRRRRSPTRSRSARRPRSNIPPTASSWATGRRAKRSRRSGYGLRFTDYPPRNANGGNCYACHQIDQGRGELRHARAEPAATTARSAISARPRPRRPTRKSTMRRRPSVLEHAALRHQQGADHRADQGSGRAADEPGQPGQQV